MAILLSGLIVSVVFVPSVQTWYAQSRLDAQPGVRGSIGEVSAGLGSIAVTDLHLETSSAVIDVPSLQATLPVTRAAWADNVQVRSLVAKGWTIDFTQAAALPAAVTSTSAATGSASDAAPKSAEPAVVASEEIQKMVRSILGGRALPYDLSLDGVELEGDVVYSPAGRGTSRVHVTIKGGGLAAGHAGTFDVDGVATNPWPGVTTLSTHGKALLSAKSSRRLGKFGFDGELTALGPTSTSPFIAQASVVMEREAQKISATLMLSQGKRTLVMVMVPFSDMAHRLEGKWKIDIRTSDYAWLLDDQPRPVFAASGQGTFAGDASLKEVKVDGQLAGEVDNPGSISPVLDRVGPVRLAVLFRLQHMDHDLQIDYLEASLEAAGVATDLHSLQSFSFDERTGSLKVANPQRVWWAGIFRKFPLAWITDPSGKLSLAGGTAAGGFMAKATTNGFSLRPVKPLKVAGVSLQMSGRPLLQNLDLSLAWQADYDDKGWRVEGRPLTLSRDGRRLVSLEAKVSRAAGADSTVTVDGKWDADLTAIAALPECPREAGVTARSALGQFTANVGPESQVEGQLTVVGHDPNHTLTASVNAYERAGGEWNFQIPLKMNFDRQITDITAEGNWAGSASGGRSYLRLTGERAELDHLRRLARPLALAAGVPWPADLVATAGESAAASVEPDRAPFWGPAEGSLVVDFGQLLAGKKTYWNVGGSLEVDHRAVQLNHVRGQLARVEGKPTPVMVDGQLTFDPDAPVPYQLKASGDLGVVDASALLPAPKLRKSKNHEDEDEEEPLLEGHFNTSVTVTGGGRNLAELARRTEQEIKLTSQGGILRLLKVYIGDAFREAPPSAAAETIGGVGTLVGKLFAIKDGGGEKKVSQATDDVLDLASQLSEIEFESLAITAVRGADGAIRLSEFSLSGPTEKLTGTGRFASAGSVPFTGQPLSLDVTVGGRGRTAELIEKAGLSAGPKDAQGFVTLKPGLHFGGSLEHLDSGMWHDVLVKAATRPVAVKK